MNVRRMNMTATPAAVKDAERGNCLNVAPAALKAFPMFFQEITNSASASGQSLVSVMVLADVRQLAVQSHAQSRMSLFRRRSN